MLLEVQQWWRCDVVIDMEPAEPQLGPRRTGALSWVLLQSGPLYSAAFPSSEERDPLLLTGSTIAVNN